MSITDFFQKSENLCKDLTERVSLRKIENKVIQSFSFSDTIFKPTPPVMWPEKWHLQAVQYAKRLMDEQNLEYPEEC